MQLAHWLRPFSVRGRSCRCFRGSSARAKRPLAAAAISRVEHLEDRTLLATFTVDIAEDVSNGDFGAGDLSLREAIAQANANPGRDTIQFAAHLAGETITLADSETDADGSSDLNITDDIVIIGLGANQLTISGGGTGGVFSVEGTSAEIVGLTISEGVAVVGAGIHNVGGHLILRESEISNNTGTLRAAGIRNSLNGTAWIENCLFTNNHTTGRGGGIENAANGGVVTIINSTFSGNTADRGGAITTQSSNLTTMINSTITNNRARNNNGGGIFLDGPLVLHNTIVAGNWGDDGPRALRNDVRGPVHADSSFNLIGVDLFFEGISDGMQGNQVGTLGDPLDAGIEELADNGGPTRTHALSEISPAKDAGGNARATIDGNLGSTALATDQRGTGFARISNDTVDIGAFELQPLVIEDPPRLAIEDVSIPEGTASEPNPVPIEITLSRAVSHPVTVEVTTASGSALAGEDFTPLNQTLTFPPGELSQTIEVLVNPDSLVEQDEVFFVNLSNANGAEIERGTGTVSIIDDDGPATITIGNVTEQEGDAGLTDFVFTLSLDQAVDAPVSMVASAGFGGANPAEAADFIANTETITFLAGETTKTFTVQVEGDQIVEPDETFLVTLSDLLANGRDVLLSGGEDALSAEGTILNDDTAQVSINDLVIAEGDTGLQLAAFVITLSAPVQGELVIDFEVQTGSGSGAAQAGEDFVQITTSPVVFTSGTMMQEIEFEILGDRLIEPNEVFQVILEPPENFLATHPQVLDSITVAKSAGQGTILNDDSLLVTGQGSTRNPVVRVFDQAHNEIFSEPIVPYAPFVGEVRVATGDVDGDGVPDIITAPGKGAPQIKIFSGVSGQLIAEFLAYDKNFRKGVFVAVADFNNDGFADILTGPDAGGGAHVKVFDGFSVSSGSQSPAEIFNFFAYDDLHETQRMKGNRGGVRVAAGDVTGDGIPDIITGSGPGMAPMVRVFDGDIPQNEGGLGTHIGSTFGPVGDFLAFDASFDGGIFVAAADFGGTGPQSHADIIVSKDGQAGETSRVRIFDAISLRFDQLEVFGPFEGGIRVAAVERTGGGPPELAAAAGPLRGGTPRVVIINGEDIDVTRFGPEQVNSPEELLDGLRPEITFLSEHLVYEENFSGGVYVAGTVFSLPADSAAASSDGAGSLSADDLAPLRSATIGQEEHTGPAPAPVQQLTAAQIVVGDLAPGRQGLVPGGVIFLDADAPGAGGLLAPPPQGRRGTSPEAWGAVSLLAVNRPELGHVLDRDDQPAANAEPLMADPLPPDLYRLPDEETLDALFTEGDLLDSLL